MKSKIYCAEFGGRKDSIGAKNNNKTLAIVAVERDRNHGKLI
jgi:hypothetical protein